MDTANLKTGDAHYTSYVGPPQQYDFMGATQFRLLCTLGLRSYHTLLDFGCGSLRAGRLFMPYLDAGHYYGIEPNRWLIEEAVKSELGEDLFRIKKPTFDYNESFSTAVFNTSFDFILAQSIFTHTGLDLLRVGFDSFAGSLKDDGLIAMTLIEGEADFDETGWVYPACVPYRPETIERLAQEAGLCAVRIPWYHPRAAWYLLAKRASRLPNRAMRRYLKGVVLFEPEFTKSWNPNANVSRAALLKRYATRSLALLKCRLRMGARS